MSSKKTHCQADRRDEVAALSATWGPLIDQGLREATATLQALDEPHTGPAEDSREAWALIGRAFQSSANALRALGS